MTEPKKIEHKGRVIEDEIRTSATPRQVWEAWTDPVKLAQWFVDKASGEAKVGGTMTWEFERFGYVIPYEVVEAVPEKYFVLRWNPPEGKGNPGILEVNIEYRGGQTVMRLVNSGMREDAGWNEEYEGIVSGWKMALAVLKHYLENYFGNPKAYFFGMRPAQFSYEQLMPYYVTEAGLAKWLTKSGKIGKPGERCELVLQAGGKITGNVLAVSAREVAVSWEEMNGVFELKAFAMGPAGRVLSFWGRGWDLDAARAKEIEGRMEKALERLSEALGTATIAKG
jgi:uncharacterized protein YndB with AHSA1/START domain